MIGYYFCGLMSTTMCEYVTVRPTGILLRATKRIVFINFFTFPGDPSIICPNPVDNTFYQRYLVSLYFYCIIYLYCSMYSVSGSITALARYQGKG